MSRKYGFKMLFSVAMVGALLWASSPTHAEEYTYWGTAPGLSSNTPTAYGASLGQVGFGAGYQKRTRYSQGSPKRGNGKEDGTIGLVVGLGNPSTAIGFDVGVSVLDLDPFGDRGSFSFKLHRLLGHDFAVAVGAESIADWGGTDSGGAGVYGVVTKQFADSSKEYFNALHMSLGVGTHRFNSENKAVDRNKRGDSVGVFGNVALAIAQPVRLFTEWTGQNLNVGLSVSPFRNFPLVVTPMIADVLDRDGKFNDGGPAGDGARFVISAASGFSLF